MLLKISMTVIPLAKYTMIIEMTTSIVWKKICTYLGDIAQKSRYLLHYFTFHQQPSWVLRNPQ